MATPASARIGIAYVRTALREAVQYRRVPQLG
jgi:hypothetical protein